MKQKHSASALGFCCRSLAAAALIGLLSAAQAIGAEPPPEKPAPPKIAVIDFDKVLTSLDSWKDAQAKIQQEDAAAQKKITELEKEIARIKAEMAYFKEGSRDYEDRKSRAVLLQQQLIQETNQAGQQSRERMESARESARAAITAAAREYALAHNLDIVLDARAALYTAGAADISLEVAREMNKGYKSGQKTKESEAPETK